MSVTIQSNTSANLGLICWKGVEPYSPQVSWTGTQQANSVGYSSALSIISPSATPPPTNTPYFRTVTTAVGRGAMTGTFVANGFTGFAVMKGVVTDAVGATSESNPLTIVVNATPMVVNAGPDISTTASSVLLTGGSVSGVSGPFTYKWEVTSGVVASVALTNSTGSFANVGPVPSPTLTATVLPLSGSATIKLSVTGAGGAYGYDYRNVNFVVPGSLVVEVALGTPSNGGGTYYMDVYGADGYTPTYPITCSFSSNNIGFSPCTFVYTNSTQVKTGNWDSVEANVTPRLPYNYLCGCVDAVGATGQQFSTGTGTCHPKGTLIELGDGTYKAVEQLVKDDLLASHQLGIYNVETQHQDPDYTVRKTRLERVIEYVVDEYIKYNGGQFSLAEGHPVFGKKKIGVNQHEESYHFIRKIEIGDIVVDKNGIDVEIHSVEVVHEKTSVYSISTSPYHSYVAEGIIMHNKSTTPQQGIPNCT